MKKRGLCGLALCATLLGMQGVAFAEGETGGAGFGLGLKVGTLGYGAELTKAFTDSISGRISYNGFSRSESMTESDIKYDADLDWQSTALMLDWHPGESTFRLSVGYVFNNNEISMTAKPSAGVVEINDVDYAVGADDKLTGSVEFDNGPYVGLGFGNAGKKGFGFSFDLGAVYQGSPTVDLKATGTVLSAVPESEIRAEEADAEDELENFTWYPVVALGISYGF